MDKNLSACPASFLWRIKGFGSRLKRLALTIFLFSVFLDILSKLIFLPKLNSYVYVFCFFLWLSGFILEKIFPHKKT